MSLAEESELLLHDIVFGFSVIVVFLIIKICITVHSSIVIDVINYIIIMQYS